ncbi:MAG: hypothetical protein GC131_08755 [Alphaproteobacteria bacterium]|nr:hypothetical protein [Alphaproteobacteria bacterium]
MDGTLIVFNPMVPLPLFAGLLLLACAIGFFALRRGVRGGWLRLLLAAAFALVLLNPSFLKENRKPVSDVAAVIVDESGSQKLGERAQQTQDALAKLQEQLGAFDDVDVRIVRAGGLAETDLVGAMQQALADVPAQRIAGTIMITDGQVHDVPEKIASLRRFGPVHALLTGKKNAFDRRLVIARAPGFGIVGRDATASVRVEDRPAGGDAPVPVTVRYDIDKTITVNAVPGKDTDIALPIGHPGDNIFELTIDHAEGELTDINNRAAFNVHGVRDRLRVLLVSGAPHPGERTWRNLLKADPAVELVHFTILRPPAKQDATPMQEMSLIAFPVKELFELKLARFDLVIFDRVRKLGILPEEYLRNIATYVENGGAFLDIGGAGYAGDESLYGTPLGRVLPTRPTGAVTNRAFTPALTADGLRHPITAGLAGEAPEARPPVPVGGPWLQQTDTELLRGIVLMQGDGGRPVFVLDHFGKGRVGQLLSDQIWLWSRGYQGGGPQAELLRRLAHWLMREPELDEESLSARAVPAGAGFDITIERRSLDARVPPVQMTAPNGSAQIIDLAPGERPGVFVATQHVESEGVYRLYDDSHYVAVPAGHMDAPEWRDMRASADVLKPLAEATRGGVFWLEDFPGGIDVRRTARGARAAGNGWLGLVRGGDYIVTGAESRPLLPAWALLALLLGLTVIVWWREGR